MERNVVLFGIGENHASDTTTNFCCACNTHPHAETQVLGEQQVSDTTINSLSETTIDTPPAAVVLHTEKKTDEFSRVNATWELNSSHKVQFTTTEDDVGSIVDVSNPRLFDAYMDSWRARVGWMFKDDTEYETFMKLPISTQERLQLLQKLTNKTRGSKRPNT